ncbi:MAG: hypothetical protein LBT45_00915 [Rickettsiales bacterium]|jgi:hypothetical protein|nr:hypothetical protein [Rickettsiales bacterium]
MKGERGAGLLELLLAMAIFMEILPFVYNFVKKHREQAENVAIVKKIRTVQNALEQYISDNRQKLLAPVSKNVARVRLSELKGVSPDELGAAKIELRVVKSKDSAGHSFVQGIVIFDSPSLSPLRTRQIAAAGGQAAGFADGLMLYGSFGTWQAPMSSIGAAVGGHSILAETRTFRSGGDYLQRLPSADPLDATMQSDMDLGGHDIEDAKTITSVGARFLDTVETDGIEASKMTVLNRMDWTAPLETFGDATVNGAISSDGRSIDAAEIVIAGRSQFRSVSANELKADNLYLSGFSVSSDSDAPPVLSISGTLDMKKGHIKAIDAFVGFSGSVAPKLIVSERIEDSGNPGFYWDMSGGDAVFADLHLSTLTQMMKYAYGLEKTGKTETERLMGNVILNSNATVADYMRALEQARRAVERKYNDVMGEM